MAKVKVYRKDTGEIARVPEHWMEHPVLGAPFRKTPSQKSRDLAKEAAAEAEAEAAALAAVHTSTERAGTAAKPTHPRESANAGDDKKE